MELNELNNYDYFFEDQHDDWSLTDGQVIGHQVYFDYEEEDRINTEEAFLSKVDDSEISDFAPGILGLICELNKTMWLAKGEGFTVEELNVFCEQASRRLWIKQAIQCKEFQKEILLDLYTI
jgi:hypothetical protein